MARKVATVIIDAEGRDQGKVFVLTEMPSSQGERWAMRALLALARSGVDVPDNLMQAGWAGIAALGVRAFGGMSFHDAEPLLEEMMRCVVIQPDPAQAKMTRQLVETDIEEIATRLRLRMEVFRLHSDFFPPAAPSPSTSGTATAA